MSVRQVRDVNEEEDTQWPREASDRTPSKDDPNNGGEASEEDDQPAEKKPTSRTKKTVLIVIAILVAGALATAGTLYYLWARQYESTDDAQIDGQVSLIAAQVSGRVLRLEFRDNQDVSAGQALLEIDPRDYQVRLDQARGNHANVEAQVSQMQAQIGLQQANIDQAIANAQVSAADLAKAQRDLARNRSVNPAAVARQQVDDSASAERSATAKLEANRQAVAAARAQLETSRAQLKGAKAQLAASDAEVANAELQLSYTHVTAPFASQVTKRSVDVGNYVTPGAALLYLVPRDVWITANFKENQTGEMHVGQPVEIRIDQYPGLTFHGQVDSFQNGTGSAFSTLPAENATGNFVKVVQRVPVKITFDQHPTGAQNDLRLSPGLSVVPRVTVR